MIILNTLYFIKTESQSVRALRVSPSVNCLQAWLLPRGFELQLAELAFQSDKAIYCLSPLVQYTMEEILEE